MFIVAPSLLVYELFRGLKAPVHYRGVQGVLCVCRGVGGGQVESPVHCPTGV